MHFSVEEPGIVLVDPRWHVCELDLELWAMRFEVPVRDLEDPLKAIAFLLDFFAVEIHDVVEVLEERVEVERG